MHTKSERDFKCYGQVNWRFESSGM